MSIIFLCRLKQAPKYFALTLSFLVSMQMMGVNHFIEEVVAESDLLEEVTEEYVTNKTNPEVDHLEDYVEEEVLTYIDDAYDFSSITKKDTPSTPTVKYYILYQQLAYDKV